MSVCNDSMVQTTFLRLNFQIDGDLLFRKATYFRNEFRYTMVPSSSWTNRWKKQWGIGKILKSGESSGIDMDVAETWRRGEMKGFLEAYLRQDIYKKLR